MLIIPVGLFGYGLFSVLENVLKLPTKRHILAIKSFDKPRKKMNDLIEEYSINLAIKVEKFIKLDGERIKKINKDLRLSRIDKSAENFIAYIITKTLIMFLIGAILILIIGKMAILIAIVFGIKTYNKELNKPRKIITEKRKEIEKELYRFTATIEQESKNHKDVIKMLKNFKIGASQGFKKEIQDLIVDMELTSYESALIRFETKINSSMLSEVVRGLINILNGDDNSNYFKMLSFRFREFELNRLDKEAKKIPERVTKFSMLMLMAMLLIVMSMFAMQIMDNAGILFN